MSDFIPPHSSITPHQLQHRYQNGSNTFREIINQNSNNTQLLLNPSNWMIIIDHMYQNIASKLNLLNHVKTLTSNTLLNNDKHRIIEHQAVKNTSSQLPGFMMFLKALGFQDGIIDNKLVMLEPNQQRINTAIKAIQNAINIHTYYKDLNSLWQTCIKLMLNHTLYQNQSILHKLNKLDFVVNYNDYYDILNKLIAISEINICSRDELIQQMMINIGITIDEYAIDDNNMKIYQYMELIYDQFKIIEISKQNMCLNNYYTNDIGKMNDSFICSVNDFIPANCSITTQQMLNRRNNGVKIFQEIINEHESTQLLLNPANWNIIIDCIWQNTSMITIETKVALLIQLKWIASKSLSRFHKHKIINLEKHPYKILSKNKGCIEFVKGLGFKNDNTHNSSMILRQCNKEIINIAVSVIDTKIDLINYYEKLSQLWKICMQSMLKNKFYTKQSIVSKLIRFNFVINYYEYYDILQKLLAISNIKILSRDELIEQMMINIGFNVHKNSAKIHQQMDLIYDQFKIIENLKESMELNNYYELENDDSELKQAEISQHEFKMYPTPKVVNIYRHLTVAEMNNRKTSGIEYFERILNNTSIYHKEIDLLNPTNWDILLDAICLNINNRDNKIKRLTNLKDMVQKALHSDEYRVIKLDTVTSINNIVDIMGAIVFLKGVGFQHDISSNTLIFGIENEYITDSGINAIIHKIKMFEKLLILQNIWQNTAQIMWKHPSFVKKKDIITQLYSMDLYNNYDNYYEILIKVLKLSKINDESKSVEFVRQLGLDLGLGIVVDEALTRTLLSNISSIYTQIIEIENEKRKRYGGQDNDTAILEHEMKQNSSNISFSYVYDFDRNGIIYWLGTNRTSSSWKNPAISGIIKVLSSSLAKDSEPCYAICGRKTVRCMTENKKWSWFMIDLLDIKVIPTHYSLRHYSSFDSEALRNWRLEGCNNSSTGYDGTWVSIRKHVNDTSLHHIGATHTWKIPITNKAFSQFKIFQFAANSEQHNYMALSGFELYGTISDTNINRGINQLSDITQPTEPCRTFTYQNDFDSNGLLYFLGVQGGTATYNNPAKIGMVTLSSSKLMSNSQSLSVVVGRVAERCITKPQPDSWIKLNLHDVKIKLTHYTLRHYNSWDTERLRYWILEGKNDTESWVPIRKHENDNSLKNESATHTWKINTNQFFSQFRIYMTGLNSNNHWHLACSGLELYGIAFGGVVSKRYNAKIMSLKPRIVKKSFKETNSEIDTVHYGWDNNLKSYYLKIWSDCVTVSNDGSQEKWQGVCSKMIFSGGRHSFEIQIIDDVKTGNRWKYIFGVVPLSFDPKKIAWLGSQNSWGYIGGTGGKIYQDGKSIKYGEKYGVNDRIKAEIDFNKHTIEFFKNGKSQGIAFDNLKTAVRPAISFTGKGTTIKICIPAHKSSMRQQISGEFISHYTELNKIWRDCMELMTEQQAFNQQCVVLNKLKSFDFENNINDYDEILKKYSKISGMKIYSEEELAGQIIKCMGFSIPQIDNMDKILKQVIQIYKLVEDIELIKQGKETKYVENTNTFIRRFLSLDKDDADFKNNDDNVIGNFSPPIGITPFCENENFEFPPIYHIQQHVNSSDIICEQSLFDCKYVDRVIVCLQYYQTLDMTNIIHQTNLIQFLQEQHVSLLDDHIHIITKHSHEIHIFQKHEQIFCVKDNCLSLQRYYKDSNITPIGMKENENFAFYRDILDSIHCYVYHQNDMDLGTNVNKNDQSNKFTINNVINDSDTMFEGLYEYLISRDIEQRKILQIFDFLKSEEYDSDALTEDIRENNTKCSNINNITIYANQISHYVKSRQSSARSFSIGYRFYYWPYYKQQLTVEYFQNKNDHSGYQPYELYIDIKYDSIKQEILNNSICTLNINQFNISWNKASKFMNTTAIKKIFAEENRFLYYDIWQGTPLLILHILSVILYCDWSLLSTKFRETFRKRKSYESIDMIKERNREYGNWSKSLRETVELYGKRGWEKRDKDETKWNADHNRIRGPFYCGMKKRMVMVEFNIRLCSPTSTSKKLHVAQSFSDDNGIIIQLNNNGHWLSNNLRIWDCSWISNYNGEDEKLLMGGLYTIKIEDIRIKKPKFKIQNFKNYFEPLFYYDCMLTGISMLKHEPIIKDKHKKILNHLILYHLNTIKKCEKINSDKYIHDTFSAYSNHRKQIVVNLHQIYKYFGKLKDLVIEISSIKTWTCPLCGSKGNNINSSRCWACEATSPNTIHESNNLLKPIIFEIFRNIDHFVMYTTSGTGQNEYVFDLEKWLITMHKISLSGFIKPCIKIEIKASHRYEYNNEKESGHIDRSWLSKTWEQIQYKLQTFAKSNNWNICLKHTENHGARVYLEDTLTVTVNS